MAPKKPAQGEPTEEIPPPKALLDLVERYERNQEAYESPDYNETQLRREFLDPLLKLLGWDVDNEQGHAEAYKEVIHEDRVRVEGSTKAPDYSVRFGGVRKFFVEAKKPAVNLKDDPTPALQVRRYGWNAKLPLCILTDFEEFAVYDTRIRPKNTDSADTARIRYFNYKAYPKRWGLLYGTFSKDAVLKGSFDKWAASWKDKKGTSEVDDAFLKDIEEWRTSLAQNIALRNEQLAEREVNFCVQRTIDRLVFLRICEDRGLETYGRLRSLLEAGSTYQRLQEFFRLADQRYNSGLFHFEAERGRTNPPDTLTPSVTIDDKILKEIIKHLYYPDSPYEFSILPADILGQVYEQFLGKVIRLTKAHRAKVEDKPEVKKAGGVFYTPTFIVDYIVANTVGKRLDGKRPADVRGLKVLDPACGSGSFLIAAYQFLLDWYAAWYEKDGPKKHKDKIYQGPGGAWHLTIEERKRILLDHIYGVDIDPQAVEVTKLSLLLKVLEQVPGEVVDKNQKLFHTRALPDLENSIKCGNSLLDHTHIRQLILGDDERLRVNPFDWRTEFPQVFGANGGGFDVVIGNPPYIRVQTMNEWAPLEVELYKKHYRAASKGNYDIYVVFVERGLQLLNEKGRLGFILPHKFFNAKYGELLRGLIAEGRHLAEVVHFGDLQVFENATTYTCLMFLDRGGAQRCRFAQVADLVKWRLGDGAVTGDIPAGRIASTEWNFHVGEGSALFEKLSRMPIKLGNVAHLFVGLQTDADDVFIVEEVRREGGRVLCQSKATGQQHWFEDEHLKHFLKGSLNIRRYHLSDVTKRLIFPYESRGGKSALIAHDEYERRFPLTWAYLLQNKDRLSKRNKGKMGGQWQGYVYKKNHERLGTPKLLIPSIGTGSCFAADLEGKYFFVGSGGGGGGGYGIALSPEHAPSAFYFLGILNSRLLSHHLRTISTPFRGGYLALNKQVIEQLPIRIIDFTSAPDKARHDRMVELVERILGAHRRLATTKTPHDQSVIEREIQATEQEINRLVYELYDLTAEEIVLVEKGAE